MMDEKLSNNEGGANDEIDRGLEKDQPINKEGKRGDEKGEDLEVSLIDSVGEGEIEKVEDAEFPLIDNEIKGEDEKGESTEIILIDNEGKRGNKKGEDMEAILVDNEGKEEDETGDVIEVKLVNNEGKGKDEKDEAVEDEPIKKEDKEEDEKSEDMEAKPIKKEDTGKDDKSNINEGTVEDEKDEDMEIRLFNNEDELKNETNEGVEVKPIKKEGKGEGEGEGEELKDPKEDHKEEYKEENKGENKEENKGENKEENKGENKEVNKDESKNENKEEVSELAREMALFNEYEKENEDVLLDKVKTGRKRSFSDSSEADASPSPSSTPNQSQSQSQNEFKDADVQELDDDDDDVEDDDDDNDVDNDVDNDEDLFKNHENKIDQGSERKEGEEDVCFFCCDGGELIVCDKQFCPKSYHVECSKRGELFKLNKGSWGCDWHYCSICQRDPTWQCQTCPTAYCEKCYAKNATQVFNFSKGKGLCDECRSLILIIESGNTKGPKGEIIDFNDYETRESLFKEYWKDYKAKNKKNYSTFMNKTRLSTPQKDKNASAISSETDKIIINDSNGGESTESEGNGENDKKEKRKEEGKSEEDMVVKKKRGRKPKVKNVEQEKHAEKKRKTIPPDLTVVGDDVDMSLMNRGNGVEGRGGEGGGGGREEEEDMVFEKEAFDGWASSKLIRFLNEVGEEKEKNITSSSSPLSFAHVAKVIRGYIIKNGLKDQNNKNRITCDPTLMSLFTLPIIQNKHLIPMIKSHMLLRTDKKKEKIIKKDEMIARRKKVIGKSTDRDSSVEAIRGKGKEKIDEGEGEDEMSPSFHSKPFHRFDKRNRKGRGRNDMDEDEEEGEGWRENGGMKHNTTLERRGRKGRGKGKKDASRMNRPHPSELAAITPKNISLIYLRRKLLEEMVNTDDFDMMVVNTYVRMRVPSLNKAVDDSYRLVRVTGTYNQGSSYTVGFKLTNKVLLIKNNQNNENLTIDNCSNQDFLPAECKKLRDLMKWGLLDRLTVGEIEQKAIELKKIKYNEWYEIEIKKLQNLRDRASDLGLKKELRKNVEKIKEMESSGFKEKKISELVQVDADPSMGNASDDEEEEDDGDNNNDNDDGKNTRKETNWTNKSSSNSITTFGWAKPTSKQNREMDKDQEKDKNRYEFRHPFSSSPRDYAERRGGHDSSPRFDAHPSDSSQWRNSSPSPSPSFSLNRSRSFSKEESTHPPSSRMHPSSHETSYGISNWGGGGEGSSSITHPPNWNVSPSPSSSFSFQTPPSPYPLRSTLSSLPPSHPSPSPAFIAEKERKESEVVWFYTDPKGMVQGPFPAAKLKQWNSNNLFPPNLTVWKVGQSPQQAISLAALLLSLDAPPPPPPPPSSTPHPFQSPSSMHPSHPFGKDNVGGYRHFNQSSGLNPSQTNGPWLEERKLGSVWENNPNSSFGRNPSQSQSQTGAWGRPFTADGGQPSTFSEPRPMNRATSGWDNQAKVSSNQEKDKYGPNLDSGWGKSVPDEQAWSREKGERRRWSQNGMEDNMDDKSWREKENGGYNTKDEDGWGQVSLGERREVGRFEGDAWNSNRREGQWSGPGGRGGRGGRGEGSSSFPCRYFKEGNCRKGDRCAFRHD